MIISEVMSMSNNYIRRGTTPTHTYTLPVSDSAIDNIYITYAQYGVTVVELTGDSVTITSDDTDSGTSTASVTLTQEQTLDFVGGSIAEIQVRFTTTSGVAFASQKIQIDIDPIIKDGVI